MDKNLKEKISNVSKYIRSQLHNNIHITDISNNIKIMYPNCICTNGTLDLKNHIYILSKYDVDSRKYTNIYYKQGDVNEE